VTPFDPKVSRDQHFVIGRKATREMGPYKPTSTDVGEDAWKWKLSKPEVRACVRARDQHDPFWHIWRWRLCVMRV
jgi:hypothetical protein